MIFFRFWYIFSKEIILLKIWLDLGLKFNYPSLEQPDVKITRFLVFFFVISGLL